MHKNMKIETRQLVKTYKNRVVVDHVSITVEQGSIVGLLGPNGAGKTTTFYMIVGIIRPDEGDVTVDGTPITNMPIHLRHQFGIGYLPQEASIFRKLSVKDNLMALLETRKDLNRVQKKEKADQLMEEFHISHVQDSIGSELSGGERRRVEIARALTMDPFFILLDEPFAGVDPLAVEDIQKVVGHLKGRGIGILITDHNVRETLSIVDRAYILSEGKVLLEGPAQMIAEHPVARKFYLGENFSL
jgi:lipopolysaccharide export system ATP-binding protein